MKEFMVFVERAVRPVQASGRRKDRMREELLAHMTAIYEEEHTRTGDEAAARDQAARRLGEPAELTRELQASVSRNERVAFALERWFGWRAPETGTRWMLRLTAQLFLLNMALSALAVLAVIVQEGVAVDLPTRLR